MKKALIGITATLLACASQASPYAVASVGSSNLKLSIPGSSASLDDDATGLKLLGGYKFTPNWAIEAGYLDFGKATLSDGTDSLDVKVNGFGVGGAFHHSLSPDVNFVARLGLASLKAKLSDNTDSVSETKTKVYGGLGLGYKLSPQMSIDAAIDLTKTAVGNLDIDARMFSIGLTFAF